MKSKLFCAAVFLVVLVTARAQVTITVTGTANSTALGYTSGNSATFTFTTTSSFANNADSVFNSGINTWFEQTTSEDQLFTSIAGTGLTGSFTRPTDLATSPFSYLRTGGGNGSNALELVATSDPQTISLGLTTPAGTQLVSIGGLITNVTPFSFTSAYTEPTTYFPAFNGTYTPGGTNFGLYDDVFNHVQFTLTSVTISASAIPETSTGATLAGLGALGLAIWRRRASASRA